MLSSWFDPVYTDMDYSKGDYVALPSDASVLETLFSSVGYGNVESDDDTYETQTASGGQFAVYLFKDFNDNDTDAIAVTWKGKSSIAPSVSTVYLQVWNRNTGAWETIDSNSAANADTEFTLSGNITSNVEHYYVGG